MGRYEGVLAWIVWSFGLGVVAAGLVSPANRDPLFRVGVAILMAGALALVWQWIWYGKLGRKVRWREVARPKVVAIGGGTGLSVLLRGLKLYDVDITAVVTVADDGGSSGRIRSEFDMPPPGDLRNCLVALADTEPLMERLWQHRFQNGEGLAGHSFGNLFIAAMRDITGDFETAIREASRVLAIRGRVLPAAKEAIVLSALMDDGTIVTGESQIPRSGKKIRNVSIAPGNVEPLPEVVRAIESADAIVVGPGSLYTSILPNLLVPGIVEAIHRSAGKRIFICNIMTQPGETDGYTASDHIQAVYRHVGGPLFDYAFVNTGQIPEEALARYREKGSYPVEADIEALERLGVRVVADNFLHYGTYARHDAAFISKQILMLTGYPLVRNH
jgi:uncharacterized cofD-like protein